MKLTNFACARERIWSTMGVVKVLRVIATAGNQLSVKWIDVCGDTDAQCHVLAIGWFSLTATFINSAHQQ